MVFKIASFWRLGLRCAPFPVLKKLVVYRKHAYGVSHVKKKTIQKKIEMNE